MSIIVGFTKMRSFEKLAKFGFINGLAKILNETTKEALVWFATTRQGGNVGNQYNIIFLG